MELEVAKMQLSDLEEIQENLIKDFDDFWSTKVLREELENKNRLRFSLYSSKAKTRNCWICGNTESYR